MSGSLGPLARRCENEVSATDRRIGRRLFSTRAVELRERRSDGVVAVVRSPSQGSLRVDLDWHRVEEAGIVHSACDCRLEEDSSTCRHLWTVLLEVDREGLSVPGRGPIHLESLPGDGAREWRRRVSEVRETLARVASSRGTSEADDREIWYLLAPELSQEQGHLVLELFERRGDGPFRPLRSHTEAGRAEDVELVRLLRRLSVGLAGIEGGRVGVPSLLALALVPVLAATGRFGWKGTAKSAARRLLWDDEGVWRPSFELEVLGHGKARARLGLARGAVRRPLSDAILLLPEGLVVFERVAGRFDAAGRQAWLEGWGRADLVVEESELGDLLEEVGSLTGEPWWHLPPEWRLEAVEVGPEKVLELTPPARSSSLLLDGTAFFDYGGRRLAASSPLRFLVDWPARHRIERSREEEELALAELETIGLRPRTGRHAARGAYALPRRDLGALTEALRAVGWTIRLEGRVLRTSDGLSFAVHSSRDWFELSGSASFGEEVRLPLATLLEAARLGEETVDLPDGSLGVVSDTWRRRLAVLADLGQEEDGDAVVFLPAQAGLLDAFLEEGSVETDESFALLRQRLRSFESTDQVAPPEGFRGQLRTYQRVGLGWLTFLREYGLGGCLADDMGLGKTVQVLALLASREPGSGPALVVAPRSVVHNWLEEAARFVPRLSVLDLSGPEREQLLPVIGEHDLVVTTYGTIRRDIDLLEELEWDTVVLDEAQAIKNSGSQTARACRRLEASHRLALTGTPLENHLGELGSILEFLNPGLLGEVPAFELLGEERSTLPPEALPILRRALAPFVLRRRKEEVLPELPEKTEQTLWCELPPSQRALYDTLRADFRQRLREQIAEHGFGRSRMQIFEALLRLRQAACHPGLLDPADSDAPSAKLEALVDHLLEVTEEGHKALVFSQFTSFLALVRPRLDQLGMVYEYLDGSTRKRAERVWRFQTDPECQLFLVSLRAGGTGLNLTAASYVFILDPWWNPAVEAQAVDRAHRIGQHRPVFAYRLIARNTVEERIVELQEAKRELAEAILMSDGRRGTSLTAEDVELLLR